MSAGGLGCSGAGSSVGATVWVIVVVVVLRVGVLEVVSPVVVLVSLVGCVDSLVLVSLVVVVVSLVGEVVDVRVVGVGAGVSVRPPRA